MKIKSNLLIKLRWCVITIFITIIFLVVYFFFSEKTTLVSKKNIYLQKNIEYNFTSPIEKTSKNIIHTKNNIGFRGPNYNSHADSLVKVIFVGGSNVECFFISDEYLWSNKLSDSLNLLQERFWVNNAGFDGLSSIGIRKMIEEHILTIKPDFIFIMNNTNDILLDYDKLVDKDIYGLVYLNNNNVGININDIVNRERLQIPKNKIESNINIIKKEYISKYKYKIKDIINICNNNNINLTFITSPLLWDYKIDKTTRIRLDQIRLKKELNSALRYEQMKLYNKALYDVCKEHSINIIDLANKFPKDSKYFIDGEHFSLSGCAKLVELLYLDVHQILDSYQSNI